MIVRSFDHLLQYGEVNIRRAVPLALGLCFLIILFIHEILIEIGMLSISKPDISIMDTLSKFSHDHDAEV